MVDEDITEIVTGILHNAAIEALPVMEQYEISDAIVAIMEHVPSKAWFVVLSIPDGPIRAVAPLETAAQALILAAVPDARPFEKSGATDWANQQRWLVMASQRIERIPRRKGARGE